MQTIMIQSEQEMIKLGIVLGEQLKAGDLLFLFGDLGAGKTTFTKGIAIGMGVGEMVNSPTFQLKKTYHGRETLNHLDLYRLNSLIELEIIEPDELVEDGVTVVEWGKLLLERLQTDYLEVRFEVDSESNSRSICFRPYGDRYRHLVEELNYADFGA